ncbi:MAG TPA: hypothetical protein VMT29_22290 [Steroidobacteraceae bacterium]|nr:hypothetical protein [Steroidobacteraceae bacterium]
MPSSAVMNIRHPGISVVWIEKYALYSQSPGESPHSIDHMFLAEVVPYSAQDTYRVRGFRGEETQAFVEFGPGDALSYVNEWLVDRKVRSHDSARELDEAFPNVRYRFSIEDAKGKHEISLLLGGKDGVTRCPDAPKLALSQAGREVSRIDSTLETWIEWSAFEARPPAGSEAALFGGNTIFVLVDNCRGETVFSSGSGQKKETLRPDATRIAIPAGTLEPGIRYTVFVSFINARSTDTVTTDSGVIAGVSVNSIAVELGFTTSGEARDSRSCPPVELRANYRWPGKLKTTGGLRPWPVDSSGLRLEVAQPLRAACTER